MKRLEDILKTKGEIGANLIESLTAICVDLESRPELELKAYNFGLFLTDQNVIEPVTAVGGGIIEVQSLLMFLQKKIQFAEIHEIVKESTMKTLSDLMQSKAMESMPFALPIDRSRGN